MNNTFDPVVFLESTMTAILDKAEQSVSGSKSIDQYFEIVHTAIKEEKIVNKLKELPRSEIGISKDGAIEFVKEYDAYIEKIGVTNAWRYTNKENKSKYLESLDIMFSLPLLEFRSAMLRL